MSVISHIRRYTPILVSVLAIGMIVSLFGQNLYFLKTIFSNANRAYVAEIAGYKIDIQEYQQQLEDQKRALGNYAHMVDMFLWHRLVLEKAHGEEYKQLGLQVPDGELVEMVQGKEVHPIVRNYFVDAAGKYDEKAKKDILQKLKDKTPQELQMWKRFEEHLSSARLDEKLKNMLDKSAFISQPQLIVQQALHRQQVDLQCFYISHSSWPEADIKVSNEALENYIKEHAKDYKTEESIEATYVAIPINPSAEDKRAFSQEIDELKKSFEEAPDGIAFAKNSTEDTPGRARIAVKKEYLPAFLQSKLPLPIGTVVGPEERGDSRVLYKIIQIDSKADEYTVAMIRKSVQPGDITRNDLLRKVDAFCGVANSKNFVVEAKNAGFDPKEIEIDPKTTQIDNLADTKKLIHWLWNTAKVKQLSSVLEMGGNYVVAVMTGKSKAAEANPKKIVQKASPLFVKLHEKATQKLIKILKSEAIAKSLTAKRALTSLEGLSGQYKDSQLVEEQNVTFETDQLGNLPEEVVIATIGTACGLEAGKISGPIATDEGVVLVKTMKKTLQPSTEEVGKFQEELEKKLRTSQQSASFIALEKLANIKDYRYKYY